MYKRFLNNNDYLAVVTEEALEQLIRGNELRLAQAEEAAEESLIEYLTENYEIEKTLQVGKNLLPYSPFISYPAGAHFIIDNKIYKATRVINGRKRPASIEYWEEAAEYVDENTIAQYTQRGNYVPGDFVKFSGLIYKCLEYNGVDYQDIRVPGLIAWQRMNVDEWIVNQEYNYWDVVKYDGRFYALINVNNANWNASPAASDNWGLIGQYDDSIDTYEHSRVEFVEYDGAVYYPILNPNSDGIKEGYNIALDDPRHSNVKKHLLRLAVYELFKLIAPNNVSSSRITDYETSIAWLRDASKLKINPQIPRKLDNENKPVVDFAIATYQRDYDPYKNPWQI